MILLSELNTWYKDLWQVDIGRRLILWWCPE